MYFYFADFIDPSFSAAAIAIFTGNISAAPAARAGGGKFHETGLLLYLTAAAALGAGNFGNVPVDTFPAAGCTDLFP